MLVAVELGKGVNFGLTSLLSVDSVSMGVARPSPHTVQVMVRTPLGEIKNPEKQDFRIYVRPRKKSVTW